MDEIHLFYDRLSGSPERRLLKILRTPGIHAVLTYRFAHWLQRKNRLIRTMLKPLQIYLNYRMCVKWGISIGNSARIGRGFWIAHYGGIFIDETATIGENFTISHDVTIGKAGSLDKRGAPTIGNNVYVAPGAKLAGRIRIGNNVKIGANAVIERDIPDNALVQLTSPRVVIFPGYSRDGISEVVSQHPSPHSPPLGQGSE